ncbi:nucleolar protein 12-like [Gastrolobium bilobum]|uniref:nucleolar protein 12-like n=1 Tax=Gastrolobium bilobum TaxID=150636 RepID=UPI002AB0FF40|nr:nucleolar protein 12-like [Gastrolobium bilobum]XP_061361172.1 nucleolar protein 12-like [Gastrolobium bilobum]
MGKKKAKDPQQTPQSNGLRFISFIFNTLFGNTLFATASLFSDFNPFRRKPQQHASVSYPTIPSQSPNNGGSGSHDSGEDKKRKRKNNKEERPILDSDSVTEASEKKSKRGSDEREGEGEGKDHNLGTQTKKGEVVIEGEEGKMKEKKRKREELEKEWEEKKYGVVVEGEEDEKERFGNKTLESKRKMIYNPADMLVSKEGYDDEDKLLRTILVGNLPLKLKKKTLLKEFKKFGEVESLVTRSVPIQDTKKPRKGAIHSKKINDSADSVHAYIVFKTEESAQASLSHNMTVVEGNHIRVDRACPPRKKHKVKIASLYDNKRTVFVGNLPFDVKDEELYQLFCGISNLESSIEAVRVIRDPHLNVGKGIAYVLFKTREAANFAVKKRSLKLRDRKLKICHARICRAKADATPSKRPNPSPAPSTPAKKLAVASRSPSNSNNKSNKKTNASYQGLRATKSDINKKVHGREKRKERMTKRAAVAAKKAKAKLFKDGGTPKQAGVKRKLDRRTPDSSLRNKKGGTPKQAGVKRKLDSRTPDSSLRNKKAKKNNR